MNGYRNPQSPLRVTLRGDNSIIGSLNHYRIAALNHYNK